MSFCVNLNRQLRAEGATGRVVQATHIRTSSVRNPNPPASAGGCLMHRTAAHLLANGLSAGLAESHRPNESLHR